LSTKIHQLLDDHGLPLVIVVAPGQSGDAPALLPLLGRLRVARPTGRPRTRPNAVRADKAYSSRSIHTHLRSRGICTVIPQPHDQQAHRKRRGSRGGRPPAFNAANYKGRNVVERRFCDVKQWRGHATRHDKLAVMFRAAVMLNAVIAWTQRCLRDTP
jgi:transposase